MRINVNADRVQKDWKCIIRNVYQPAKLLSIEIKPLCNA